MEPFRQILKQKAWYKPHYHLYVTSFRVCIICCSFFFLLVSFFHSSCFFTSELNVFYFAVAKSHRQDKNIFGIVCKDIIYAPAGEYIVLLTWQIIWLSKEKKNQMIRKHTVCHFDIIHWVHTVDVHIHATFTGKFEFPS